MRNVVESWTLWALLSAAFASLTAIFAKLGVENVNADFATFVRIVVVVAALGVILTATQQWQPLASISAKTYLFLVLSGANWLGVALIASGAILVAYKG